MIPMYRTIVLYNSVTDIYFLILFSLAQTALLEHIIMLGI